MKNSDDLFAELKEKTRLRPKGPGTVRALSTGVYFQGKEIVEETDEVRLTTGHESDETFTEEIP